jgi:hypothetical protein
MNGYLNKDNYIPYFEALKAGAKQLNPSSPTRLIQTAYI